MRTVSIRLIDLNRVTINLGFVGENEHTRVIIDCKKAFDEYPSAVQSLAVKNPNGDTYPVVTTKDGNNVLWDVANSDLVYDGDGEIQLAFTVDSVVAKTYVGKTKIGRSIIPSGTTPTPIANFIDQAETILGEVREAIPSAGNEGQVLAKKSDSDYDLEWVDQTGGGASDYSELTNKPKINNVTLSAGNNTLASLGIAAASDIPSVSGKADKVSGATNNNFAALDSNGNLKDSGHKHSDYLTSHQDISGKADKVSSAVNGNFAGLDSNGNLTDSGKKATDFATPSDVSAKYTKPGTGIPASDMASAVQTSLGKADSAYQKPSGGIPSSDLANGVLTSIIDDTAGDGDTGKVWSADKSSALQSAIDQNEGNSKNSFNGLIMDVEGYNILNATVIEGKYAHYSAKTLSILSGVNVVEFDVTNIVRFIYKYTIDTPDNRGLYFVDENNTALNTSYQTLTTEQDIVVPDGAAKCYATADYVDQIFVYEIVPGEKPQEILRSQATYSSTTSGQITYEWTNNNSKLYVHGTRSGASNTKMYNNSSKLPTGMIPGEKYRVVIKSTSGKIIMTFLPYINGSEGTAKNFYNEEIYTIPSNWTGLVIRISVTPNGATVDETIDCPEIYTIPVLKSIRDEINDLKDATNGSETNPLAYIRRDAGLLSVFHTVGCIGDSLASGESAYKNGGTTSLVDLYDFSWGQCLARLTGNTYYNFSAGGLSSRTWLSSQKATDCFDGNHKCDAYYIGLGQNDKNNSIPVGTTSDINLSDYSQNADTYCGNMGKIIQKLQEHQPKAPIFVFIDPNPPSGDQTYNNVIDDIVALFDNVWIIDLLTYAGKAMFTESTEIIGSQYRGGHYSAVGYQQIAYVIATYTDWIIRNNLSDFSQVEFIGTNYEWTT